jgi:hypothetical protein
MEEKSKEALEQIDSMKYAEELIDCGIKEAVELVLVFYRKKHMSCIILESLLHEICAFCDSDITESNMEFPIKKRFLFYKGVSHAAHSFFINLRI